MKNVIFSLMLVLVAGCSPKTELIEVIKGDSCTTRPEVVENEEQAPTVIGARIICEDGSFSVLLNGQNGNDGENAKSCKAYSSHIFDGVWLSCPDQWPVLISNGRDCKTERQDSKDRSKFTCGTGDNRTVSYVYDGNPGEKGKDGKDGKSCTSTVVTGGVNVKCGNNPPSFLPNGEDGNDGEDGKDAITPGLICDVYDINGWNSSTSLPALFVGSALKGSFTLNNFNVPDSQSSQGFPGMPTELQNKVGLEGYALDCAGYLSVPTSGDYVFKLLSDDGSELRIEDNLIINNQGLHAPQTVTSSATRLNKGPNRINVVYYQGPHTQIALELKWKGPNLTEAVVPTSVFTH